MKTGDWIVLRAERPDGLQDSLSFLRAHTRDVSQGIEMGLSTRCRETGGIAEWVPRAWRQDVPQRAYC